MVQEELVQKHMKNLDITREEAIQLIADDIAIDKGANLFKLTPEQEKEAKKARQADRKAPTAYNFPKKERKANPTKASIIAELATFLQENSENACENVEITNKERMIAFKIGENAYEITLIQKRKAKN